MLQFDLFIHLFISQIYIAYLMRSESGWCTLVNKKEYVYTHTKHLYLYNRHLKIEKSRLKWR